MPTNYSKMDLSKYRTAQEMWDDMSEVSKAKKRREYPNLSDRGIRNLLMSGYRKRRSWVKLYKDKHRCSCNKVHLKSCPNAEEEIKRLAPIELEMYVRAMILMDTARLEPEKRLYWIEVGLIETISGRVRDFLWQDPDLYDLDTARAKVEEYKKTDFIKGDRTYRYGHSEIRIEEPWIP